MAPLEWEDAPSDSKVNAIHLILLRTGSVLMFHCRAYPFWTRLYEPYTNTISNINFEVPKWPVVYTDPPYLIQPSEIFCSGHCALADGNLLVAGGELTRPYPNAELPVAPELGLRYSFIFNTLEDTNPWSITGSHSNPHIMREGRWYPTLTILKDGNILAMGGLNGFVNPDGTVSMNKIPEIYIPSGGSAGWNAYQAQAAIMPDDISYFYPDARVIPVGTNKGKVFYATTALLPPNYTEEGSPQIFNTDINNPSWTPQNKRSSPSERSAGVLLPIRKGTNGKSRILISGGFWGLEILKRVDYIDITDRDLPWSTINMQYERYDHNVIILPDRNLLFIGGQNANGAVLNSELLDTDNMSFITNQTIPSLPVERRYHSTGLLLPNAKVLMAGGRVPDSGDIEDDTERRLSVLTPAYLLDGAQPVITDSPSQITYQQTFQITVDGNYTVDSIALIKPGSVTHGNNMEQRYVELDFTNVIQNTYNVIAPSDSSLAPPGYYMLFVLKHKSHSNSGESKIPSNAKSIKLI